MMLGNSYSSVSNNDSHAGHLSEGGGSYSRETRERSEVVVNSTGLVATGILFLVLGIVGLLEDRKIAHWEKRHVRSLIRGMLYLWVCRVLDIALIGGGLFLVAKVVAGL